MNPAALTALASFGIGQAGQGFVSREAIRTKPAPTSAGDNLEKIYAGLQSHLKASNAPRAPGSP